MSKGDGQFVNSSVLKNSPSGRWTITCNRVVVLTLAHFYFASCRRIVGIISKDSILIKLDLLESSPSIQRIKLPFLERRLEFLNECFEEELTWEA